MPDTLGMNVTCQRAPEAKRKAEEQLLEINGS